MNESSRTFDFLQYQLDKFPKADMLVGKVNGQWYPLSTQEVKDTVDKLSAGLLAMGIGGHDMTVERQDKIVIPEVKKLFNKILLIINIRYHSYC